jgi:diadenosine tetraphosphate (Ap4A) HIT family hydrolase
VGPIVEGYCLIISKRHILSMAWLNDSELAELENIKKKLNLFLFKTYAKPIYFEHGSGSHIQKAGCCISHAHVHVLPIDINIVDDLNRIYPSRVITSYSEIKKNKGHGYLYFEDVMGQMYISSCDIVPTQYLRQVVAYKAKVKNWDWKEYVSFYENLGTKERLLNLINKYREFSGLSL